MRNVSIHAPARGATPQRGFRQRAPHCFNPRARTGRDDLVVVDGGLQALFQSTRPHGARPCSACGPANYAQCFNPRARTGRDRIIRPLRASGAAFQSTRPHGARRCSSARAWSVLSFQSTRPHGARHLPRLLFDCVLPVSIHAPARGATRRQQVPLMADMKFQSTRPHGARRQPQPDRPGILRVSIHAPARGATCRPSQPMQWLCCFNPRARTGRDIRGRCGCGCSESFNPRARTGRDARPVGNGDAALDVSIHAPARGATTRCDRRGCQSSRFNPRARTGRDPTRPKMDVGVTRFNPRARTGRDFHIPVTMPDRILFQSTRPHGARLAQPHHFAVVEPVSIHGPARGATRSHVRHPSFTLFQSTRPHGARQDVRRQRDVVGVVSIHAPARGATCPARRYPCRSQVSIHAPARGATRTDPARHGRATGFNPRARTGRDRM